MKVLTDGTKKEQEQKEEYNMVTSVEVFDKIRELSPRTLNARSRVMLPDIAAQLSMAQDALLVLLIELKNRGLIDIHKGTPVSVSLTSYGAKHENPPGGLRS